MHVEKEVSVFVSEINSSSESVIATRFSTGMVSDKLSHTFAHHGASDISDTAFDIVFEDVLEDSVGGGTGERMARVS
jgi:hypothetical protein